VNWGNWPIRCQARPWIYAHRGVSVAVAENTIQAFQRAKMLGADGVEFDVRLSQDTQVVVFHDTTLERMTVGVEKRCVADVPSDELCQITLGLGGTIPLLRDVLTWAETNNLALNIELKSDADEVTRLVRAVEHDVQAYASLALQRRLVFASFSAAVLEYAQERKWPWACALLLDRGQVHTLDKLALPCGIHPHWTLVDPESMSRWSAVGAFVNVWTVNDPRIAQQCAQAKVDGIITDDPASILAVFT
jgi:glycerophosphoryl diester phosphodiesterase